MGDHRDELASFAPNRIDGERMDVQVSKQSAADFDDPNNVQVAFLFRTEAAGTRGQGCRQTRRTRNVPHAGLPSSLQPVLKHVEKWACREELSSVKLHEPCRSTTHKVLLNVTAPCKPHVPCSTVPSVGASFACNPDPFAPSMRLWAKATTIPQL